MRTGLLVIVLGLSLIRLQVINAGELGIKVQDLPAGVRVATVIPDSPAATRVSLGEPYHGYPAGTLIGMEPGDLIIEINGRPVRTEGEFAAAIDTSGPTMTLRVVNLQDGNSYAGSVELGTQPRFGVTVSNFPQGARILQNIRNYSYTLNQPYRGYPPGTLVRLEPGDVVTHLNGTAIRTAAELRQMVSATNGPLTIAVTNLRDGNSYSATQKTDDIDPTPIPPVPPFPPIPPDPNPNQFPPFPTCDADTAYLLGPRMTFVWCRPGDFTMGDPRGSLYQPVLPQLNVSLTKGFWLQQTEVTQFQYFMIMGTAPWIGQPDVRVDFSDYPATFVDWNDAMTFCEKLTAREQTAGRLRRGWRFTLPTEAQWEYACREGVQVPQEFCYRVNINNINEFSWNVRNSIPPDRPQRVMTRLFSPGWKLYDMFGNVREWTRDGYVPNDQRRGGTDPFEQSFQAEKVLKGGSFLVMPDICRSAARFPAAPTRFGDVGFRIAVVEE